VQLRRTIPAIAILVVTLFGGYQMVSRSRPALSGSVPDGALGASGVIAVEEIALSSLRSGRVQEFFVVEGDRVQAGQELVRLDPSLSDARVSVARAQLAVAQAGLGQLEAGPRTGAMAAAEAKVAQAEAAHAAALQALEDAQALRAWPQDLDMQVAQAEMRVEAAEHHLKSAVALKDAAEVLKSSMEAAQDQIRNWPYPVSPPELPEELKSALYDWWQAWVGVNVAQASLDDAAAQLAHWRVVRAEPQELDAHVALAQAALDQAAAMLEVARAQRDAVKAGAAPEQLDVALARVAQAQTALDAVLEQSAELVVEAPSEGTVLALVAHEGEVVAPGGLLLAVADLSQVKLKVYITQRDLGQVAMNQPVLVTVDAFPQRQFEGHVAHIADQAQYTPRSVSTRDERVNTVFAVEILLANPQGLLKPGMPADAQFLPAGNPQ